jgi:hypothetical protein
VRLRQIFRQAAASLIVTNAHRINGGELPVSAPAAAGADFFMIERRDPDKARETLLELVASRIPDRFGLDPVRDIQVLTPMNRGPAGAVALNLALQAALNPNGAALVRGTRTYRVGDKVMQLRNDYDKNIFNGDVGFVSSIDPEEGGMVVRFDARDVAFDGSELDDLVLAYACTVHKSQGSEYPAVVIPLLTAHFMMLTKNLLYTAVTRGKRLVVLVCDPRALELAVRGGAAAEPRRGVERRTPGRAPGGGPCSSLTSRGNVATLTTKERMLRRLVLGLMFGLVVGGLLAAGLIRLGEPVFGGMAGGALAYLAAALTGAITGLVAGKPIWATDAKIEAGLKALFGALMGAGAMLALQHWGGGIKPDIALLGGGGGVPIGDLPAASLPLIAGVLGAIFGLDNTDDPEEPAPGARKRVSADATGRGTKPRVAESDDAEDEPAAKRAKH